MTRGLVVVLLVTGLTACARPRQGGLLETCMPVAQAQPGSSTPDALIGTYDLVVVADKGDSVGRRVLGTLALRATEREEAVLAGSASLDLEGVGAFTVGPLESDADSAPGVLVFASTGDRPSIMMRLGSGANLMGSVRYDGAFTVLDVRSADDHGFQGDWRSGAEIGQGAAGYFCAVRRESE